MTPKEITKTRDAAMALSKVADEFEFQSLQHRIINDASTRLYDIAKLFEARNWASSSGEMLTSQQPSEG